MSADEVTSPGQASPRCFMCGLGPEAVGSLIGNEVGKLICDECILAACDQYATAHRLPASHTLDIIRYRKAYRNIEARAKRAQEEAAKAEAADPDGAFPNRDLDVGTPKQ